jgi:hypothetical protein
LKSCALHPESSGGEVPGEYLKLVDEEATPVMHSEIEILDELPDNPEIVALSNESATNV